MSKKILAVAAAIILAAVGVVGGTLAWFTDEVGINGNIKTGKVDISLLFLNNEYDNTRNFPLPVDLMPNQTVNFKVDVKIKDDSHSVWLRAKPATYWDFDANDRDYEVEDSDYIIYTFDEAWVYNPDDGYYYYQPDADKGVGPGSVSMFESFTLSQDAGNDYAGKKLKVMIEVQAVQSEHNPEKTGWPSEPSAVFTAETEVE